MFSQLCFYAVQLIINRGKKVKQPFTFILMIQLKINCKYLRNKTKRHNQSYIPFRVAIYN